MDAIIGDSCATVLRSRFQVTQAEWRERARWGLAWLRSAISLADAIVPRLLRQRNDRARVATDPFLPDHSCPMAPLARSQRSCALTSLRLRVTHGAASRARASG